MAMSQSQKNAIRVEWDLNGRCKHLASDNSGRICSTFVNQERDDDPRRDVFVNILDWLKALVSQYIIHKIFKYTNISIFDIYNIGSGQAGLELFEFCFFHEFGATHPRLSTQSKSTTQEQRYYFF